MGKYYVTLKADVDIEVYADSKEDAKNLVNQLVGTEITSSDVTYDNISSIYFSDSTEYVSGPWDGVDESLNESSSDIDDYMTDLGKEILQLANECGISYAYDLYSGIFEFNINDLKNDKEKIKKFIASCPEDYMLNKVPLEEYGRGDEIEDYPDGYFYFLTPREFLENDVGMENVDLVDIDSINEGCHNKKKSKKKLKESEMRTQYCVDDSQMSEWKQICKAFAKKLGAKLLFVNECSCGLEFPDGTMKHVYLDEMIDYLD